MEKSALTPGDGEGERSASDLPLEFIAGLPLFLKRLVAGRPQVQGAMAFDSFDLSGHVHEGVWRS